MNWKTPLAKLHLSMVVVILMIAAFFILIAAPVQLYDSYILQEAKECQKKLLDRKRAEKKAEADVNQPAKSPDRKWDEVPPTREEKIRFIRSRAAQKSKFDPSKPFVSVEGAKQAEIDDWVEVPSDEEYSKECQVKVSWNEYTKSSDYYSERVLYDNYPNPKEMLWVGLFFLGMAIALAVLKKWVKWVFA